jgi:hypothetical protein
MSWKMYSISLKKHFTNQWSVHDKTKMHITIHYNKSWFFKRFNLTKVFTLTKRMSILIKCMGHERHMVILVSFFY